MVALIEATLSEGGVISAKAPVGELQMMEGDSARPGKASAAKAQMLAKKGETTIAERIVALEQACQAFGVVVITVNEAQLIIVEPPTEELQISAAPEMPLSGVISQLKYFSSGAVNFYWDLTVRWKGPNDRQTEGVYTGQESGLNSDPVTLPFDWQGIIRGGDNVILHVLAIAGTRTYEANIENPFKIVGANPSKQSIKAELTLEEQVLAYLESRFRQFNSQQFPLWGYPDGWGVMQVDPPSNDEQLWDWKKNVAEGKRRFQREKVRLAQTYSDRVRSGTTWRPIKKNGKWKKEVIDPVDPNWYQRPYNKAEDLSEDELIYEMFQRYNGGVYCRWDPDRPGDPESGGTWIMLYGLTDPIHYGSTAHAVYTVVRKVQSGELPPNRLPPGWN